MTDDEFLTRVFKMLPNATVDEDVWSGELTIYTGLRIRDREIVVVDDESY